jgi:hypothetical protein
VRSIGLHQRPIERRMGRDQSLLNGEGHGLIEYLLKEAAIGKPLLSIL